VTWEPIDSRPKSLFRNRWREGHPRLSRLTGRRKILLIIGNQHARDDLWQRLVRREKPPLSKKCWEQLCMRERTRFLGTPKERSFKGKTLGAQFVLFSLLYAARDRLSTFGCKLAWARSHCRKQRRAQARCRKALYVWGYFSQRTSNRRERLSQEWSRSTTHRRGFLVGSMFRACALSSSIGRICATYWC
jgi:hypothetical protein